MDAPVLTGGCHCGAIRYEAEGTPFHATICHCADCRRAAGAPCVAWFTLRRDGLRMVQGALRRHASSPGVERGFCGDCGTPVTFVTRDHPEEVDVTTASLDDPALVPPADHTRTARRIPWLHMEDGLPQYPGARSEGTDPGATG